MITNDQKVEMFRMRVEGTPLAEIGEKYGISKQGVQQMLGGIIHTPREVSRKCVYPNLQRWCVDHETSFRQLAIKAGVTPQAIYGKMSGEIGFTQIQIDGILEVTGLTYEEAFMREDQK